MSFMCPMKFDMLGVVLVMPYGIGEWGQDRIMHNAVVPPIFSGTLDVVRSVVRENSFLETEREIFCRSCWYIAYYRFGWKVSLLGDKMWEGVHVWELRVELMIFLKKIRIGRWRLRRESTHIFQHIVHHKRVKKEVECHWKIVERMEAYEKYGAPSTVNQLSAIFKLRNQKLTNNCTDFKCRNFAAETRLNVIQL